MTNRQTSNKAWIALKGVWLCFFAVSTTECSSRMESLGLPGNWKCSHYILSTHFLRFRTSHQVRWHLVWVNYPICPAMRLCWWHLSDWCFSLGWPHGTSWRLAKTISDQCPVQTDTATLWAGAQRSVLDALGIDKKRLWNLSTLRKKATSRVSAHTSAPNLDSPIRVPTSGQPWLSESSGKRSSGETA